MKGKILTSLVIRCRYLVSIGMKNNIFHLERQGALYAAVATFLLLLSRSLTNDYELTELFVAVNHVLVFLIIFMYLKSMSIIARIYDRPLRKDPLRICVWICFGVCILLTALQFVAEKALLDSKAVTVISVLTSIPVSLGIYCLYVKDISKNSKLRLHSLIGFGISMLYLAVRLISITLAYFNVASDSFAMTILSKSSTISLFLYFYVFIMAIAYYIISRERDSNLAKTEEELNDK